MKIKTNNYTYRKILEYFVLISLSAFVCEYKNPIMALVWVLVELLYIFVHARFSIITFFSFIVDYCLYVEYCAFVGDEIPGLLGLNLVTVYYWELVICCCIFNIFAIYLVRMTRFLEDEKDIYRRKIRISPNLTVILCASAIILTLLIFPSIPIGFAFNKNTRFSSGIIPLAGWSLIPYFFVSVAILSKHKKKIVYICTFFVCVWYAMHGERVDAMGMFAFIIFWMMNTKKMKLTRIITISILGILCIAVMTIIGITRGGTALSQDELMKSILVQHTACDVTNVFNCAVDLYKSGKSFGGITYKSYIINCIPFLTDNYSFSRKIGEVYHSAGGGLIFSESIANGGGLLLVLFCFLFFSLFRFIVKHKTKYYTMIYIVMFISAFRLAWYGLSYPLVTIIYFIPFVLLINKLLYKTN